MANQLRMGSAQYLGQNISQLFSSGLDPEVFLSALVGDAPVLLSAVDINGQILFASSYHLFLDGVADSLADIRFAHQLFPEFVSERFQPSLVQVVLNQELELWQLSVASKLGHALLFDISHQVHVDTNTGCTIIFTLGVESHADERNAADNLKEQQARLSYLNFHDSLTGLPNRSLFYDRVNKSLARAMRDCGSVALLLFDLDRFRNINESLGHESGDFILREMSVRLQQTLRDNDIVARLGSDEFAIVLEDVERQQDIEQIVDKLLQRVADPICVQGHDISCTASIGVSLYPKDGDSIDKLLKFADLAVSRAKSRGKNRSQFYESCMADKAVNSLLLENDLRKAIDNDDLCLHYQPQIDLATGKISGLEALVRWNHVKRGMISPAQFIPLAEETGLIEPLGAWVLYHACQQFQAWLKLGLNFGKVAVNLSARQFRQEHLEQQIVKILLQTKLSPEHLELELTESSAMENPAETIQVLHCLSDMGLSLAIDDFGTGYSSLAYLKRFPIDKLKIDRSFINEVDVSEVDAAIAKSIIDLGHNMNFLVVAEGVERLSQSQWLVDRGCDQVQGFYYAKPMTLPGILALTADVSKTVISQSGVRLLSLP